MRLLLCLLSLSAFAADWDRKPFPDWSDQDVLRLLTNSPWTRARSVDFHWYKRDRTQLDVRDIPGTSGPNAQSNNKSYSPIGGIGVPKSSLPASADLLIRWSSSLPIRQAVALYKGRDAKLSEAEINKLIGTAGPDYILEIHGLPAEIAHLGTGALELAATRSVTVRTARGRTLTPSRAEARLDGLNVTLFLHFPRTVDLTLEDRDLDVEADFEVFRFKERFSLKAMRYLGHLDL